jgi:hypothetical protein
MRKHAALLQYFASVADGGSALLAASTEPEGVALAAPEVEMGALIRTWMNLWHTISTKRSE